MKIWFITIGEPIPFVTDDQIRKLRTAQFSENLSFRGHDITWWTSAFSHQSKKQWVHKTTTISHKRGYNIVLLKGRGYTRNISLRRILDEKDLTKEFLLQIDNTDKPELIICSIPSIYLAKAAVNYANLHDIPIVLDGRDMWPDIFTWHLPRALRWAGTLALLPLELACRKAFRNATAVMGITDEFVNWGLEKAGRSRSALDRAIPFAYSVETHAPDELAAAEAFWDANGLVKDGATFKVLFVGTIANTLDIDAVVNAARDPRIQALPILFVVAGAGDKLDHYRTLSRSLTNMIWPGWVNAVQIRVAMSRSHVGLDPMPNRFDFLATINNKAIEYFSGGLPVISSPPKGVLAELLARAQAGCSYSANNGTQLADRILELVQNPSKRDAMAVNAGRLFKERFELSHVISEFESYLVELTS